VPLVLGIEISNPSAAEEEDRAAGFGPGVAVGVRDGAEVRVLGTELLAQSQRHDDDLMPAVDRLMTRIGASPRELGWIAVSVGPGGYTALRIAVATAKMLSEATGALCIAVPSALAVARRVEQAEPFAVALASKGESTWVTVIGRDDPAAGRIMSAADVDSLDVPLLIADRFLPEAIRRAALTRGMRIDRPRFDAAACCEMAAILPEIDALALAPIYAREADAVTQWRKRKGA
jgi:tRNA threonylcarbamoyladenosine biosynthesis protein TsaB